MWSSSETLAIAEANAYGGQRGIHPSHKLNLQNGEQVLQVSSVSVQTPGGTETSLCSSREGSS